MAARAKTLPRVVALFVAASGCPAGNPPAPPAAQDLMETAAPARPTEAPPRPQRATEPKGLGLLRQPAPLRISALAPALYEVGAFPLRETPLRPGPEDDRRLVEVHCVGCHSTAYIAMQPPLTKSAWEAVVQKMRGAYGAVLSDPAAERIATYLSSYYGQSP